MSRKWEGIHTHMCTQACTPCPSSHVYNTYAHTCSRPLTLPYTLVSHTHMYKLLKPASLKDPNTLNLDPVMALRRHLRTRSVSLLPSRRYY